MKHISITIAGHAGVGKTVIVHIIRNALLAHGIDITVSDDSDYPSATILAKSIKALAGNVVVDIQTVQLPRPSIHP